jgi:hypothetical protein
LLTEDCGCSGRDVVHDEMVDARLGERKGCDDAGGDCSGESTSREVSDCAEATDGGAVELDMFAMTMKGGVWSA